MLCDFSVADADWLSMSTSNMVALGDVFNSVRILLSFLMCITYAQAKERFEPHSFKMSDPFDVKPGGSEHTYTDSWVRK